MLLPGGGRGVTMSGRMKIRSTGDWEYPGFGMPNLFYLDGSYGALPTPFRAGAILLLGGGITVAFDVGV